MMHLQIPDKKTNMKGRYTPKERKKKVSILTPSRQILCEEEEKLAVTK